MSYTDQYLVFPDEATFKAEWPWLVEGNPGDPSPGALDVIGPHNGKFLVNLRLVEALPAELQPYAVAKPENPQRVFA